MKKFIKLNGNYNLEESARLISFCEDYDSLLNMMHLNVHIDCVSNNEEISITVESDNEEVVNITYDTVVKKLKEMDYIE